MSMQLRIVDSSSFIFETDLPPSSRNIHPSGILHSFRTTKAHNQPRGGTRRRQEHTFAWVENSLHVDAALKHLQKNGFVVSQDIVFIPYSTKSNWTLRYPHASPAMECNDAGKVTVHMKYRPYPNGLGELGEAPPLEYHPPTSMKKKGVEKKRKKKEVELKRKKKGKHMNLVQDKTLLPDAERDELHVEIYKYLGWLHERIAVVKANADVIEKSKNRGKDTVSGANQSTGDETTKELKNSTNKQNEVSTGKRKRESRIFQGVDMHEFEKALAHLKYSFAVITKSDEADDNVEDNATTTTTTKKKVPFLEDALDEELAKLVKARNQRMSRRSGEAKATNNGGSGEVNTTNNGVENTNDSTADLVDPVDDSFRLSLACPDDKTILCDAHVTLREDILTIRRTRNGKIFFQCKYCMNHPTPQSVSSVFTPRSVSCIQQNALKFKRKHIPVCYFIPQEYKDKMTNTISNHIPKRGPGASTQTSAIEGASRLVSIPEYWISSAESIGLRDGEEGIVLF